MNYQNKTKDELITELRKLQQEYDSLKTLYLKDITERKQAEEALQKSEKLLRIVITNAPISIFATNEKGIFILHEGKALEKTGMKPGDNVGVSAYELFSELNVVEHDGKVTNGKSVLNRILNGESLSGFTELNGVHFDNQFVPLRDINDQVIGLIGVATDVTTSKKGEAALRESELRFRSLFENSLVGISLAHPCGGLLQVNNAYARMYGYEDPSELMSLIHDTNELYANPEERKEVIRILRAEGFMEAREFELIRRDGSHFFALVSACEIRDSEGKLLYNQATHIDLTERKKIEKEIHDASLYARNLIEASLDPLVTISINGKITDVNRATEEISGIKRENLIGTDFAVYFTEPDKARKGYKTVFSKGKVKDYPLSILHTNGRIIDVLYNGVLFKNEAGEVQGVFAAARDITERKKMESNLRNSKRSLEKLNQHLIEVRENERAAISREIHDRLGQSLTALKIDLSWLRWKMTGESEEGMKLNEMIELVNATSLDVHRISSELRPAIFDDLGLAAALEWYCEEFENRTGLKLQMEIEDLQTGNTIKDLAIYRVAQEALTNIIRHAGAKKVQIKLHKTKNDIVLTIQDDGVGISPDNIRSTKSFGLLGMFERAHQSGGHIEIKAHDTGGTSVKVFMPVEKL
jgi:PAS domain S-box-containing protein